MQNLTIAAAQVASVRGKIDHNIATHLTAITTAARHGVSMLVFPELSLTGYERDLAAELAMTSDGPRLDPLRSLAVESRIDVVAGAPLRNGAEKPSLGAIVFGSDGVTRTYRKMHLGVGERAFFAPGDSPLLQAVNGHAVGVAICADATHPSHPQWYAAAGAGIYAAGVCLNEEWFQTDAAQLASYAPQHGMLVVMANHGASVGTYTSVGKSAAWSPRGEVLAQTSSTENALVIATSDGAGWSGEVVGL